MPPKTKKRTRRTEPAEAPPPQRSRPNTPEPTPNVVDDIILDDNHRELATTNGYIVENELWNALHFEGYVCSIDKIQSYFALLVDSLIENYNARILQLTKDELPAPEPLPPYSTSRSSTPVPPPPPAPKSEAAVQTDKEALPNPPPQRTYAEAATTTDPQPSPKAPEAPPRPRPHHPRSHPLLSKPSTTTTPSSRPSPKTMGQRVVVHIGKSTFYSSRLGVPAVLPNLHKDISDALEKEGEIIKCLGVKLSRSKNLILTFPAKSSKAAIAAAFPTLRNTLLLPQNVRLSFDTPWSYLSFANVPTRLSPDATPFSVLELLTEVRNNPNLKDVAFTHLPSWVSDPKRLAKPRSSIAFAFEDPTGSILRKIKQSECFMFGTSIHIRDWSPRPPTSQPRPASGPMDTSS